MFGAGANSVLAPPMDDHHDRFALLHVLDIKVNIVRVAELPPFYVALALKEPGFRMLNLMDSRGPG